ncbi:MAG: Ribosomal RNA small subunit methyltransferase G [Syntrophus sp. PtaB.Bin001]|nr:MAG: Ribosomal RNA small subunit methyltransferase G [Syntrophus sp. PtaB.Bin001]
MPKTADTSREKAVPAQLCQLLKKSAEDFNVFLSDRQLNSFLIYHRELKLWNSRINLISSSESSEDIFIKHFLDSLTIVPHLCNSVGMLLDIGTGGGFPGLPLKIYRNDLKVTLLEASRKKVSFLKSLCRMLELQEIDIIQERVENILMKERYHNRFDAVVSRAAFKLPEYLSLGKELVSPNGLLIAMKGANYQLELDEIKEQLGIWNLFLSKVHCLKLPVSGDFRAVLIFQRSISQSSP